MKTKVRSIDGRHLLNKVKHDIEILMQEKKETVEVDLAI